MWSWIYRKSNFLKCAENFVHLILFLPLEFRMIFLTRTMIREFLFTIYITVLQCWKNRIILKPILLFCNKVFTLVIKWDGNGKFIIYIRKNHLMFHLEISVQLGLTACNCCINVYEWLWFFKDHHHSPYKRWSGRLGFWAPRSIEIIIILRCILPQEARTLLPAYSIFYSIVFT